MDHTLYIRRMKYVIAPACVKVYLSVKSNTVQYNIIIHRYTIETRLLVNVIDANFRYLQKSRVYTLFII